MAKLYLSLSLLFTTFLLPLSNFSQSSPSPSPSAGDDISPPPATPSPSPALPLSPPAPPPSDLAPSSPSPAPTPSPSPAEDNKNSPAPAPVVAGTLQAGDDDSASAGMSGGKKAGIAVGVIAAACVVGVGALVYKKRKQNISRSQYSSAARRDFL